jgi:phosphopantothenoylcysteine decarboxylase/phosphopantothenate--cysteine ligase
VGFAAESENVLEYAQAKRIKKNVPLMIANQGPKTFGSEYNQVSLVSEAGVAQLPNMRKDQLAQQLIQAIAKQFASQQK